MNRGSDIFNSTRGLTGTNSHGEGDTDAFNDFKHAIGSTYERSISSKVSRVDLTEIMHRFTYFPLAGSIASNTPLNVMAGCAPIFSVSYRKARR
jgi:hypothetical protein